MSPYLALKVLLNSPKTIENLLNSFQKHGFDGLKEPELSGRPVRLSEIIHEIRHGPRHRTVPENVQEA
ncbi:hypothetical protein [Ferroplasma sp.]|uniref:hypothetical protein n=1 Tax=Ferroplasma sp. TaxID=2591003 RepID=UPI0026244781|nr:hypothetical protein [Ferroplasma sp.]